MADAMRGACSMTPVVTNVGTGNSADVDVLHDDIKATLGGKMVVDATIKYFDTVVEADGDGPKWFYCPDIIFNATAARWYTSYSVSGGIWNGNDTSQSTVCSRYTTWDLWNNTIIATDQVRMLYVENTGVDDTGAATTNVLVVSDQEHSTPLDANAEATKFLEPGESIIMKYAWNALLDGAAVNADCAAEASYFYFQALGASGAVASGPDHVCAKIVAFMEDGS